jgi:oligopeptide/dipeptide ABC transporter ATP-binding protein
VTALLQIRNLDVAFDTVRGEVRALRGVSFDVPRGKIVGVVGESGSGKSTVIWAITGLLSANGRIAGGEIAFDGRNLLTLTEEEMRAFRGQQASVVFQDPMTSQIPVKSYLQQMLDILYRSKDSRSEKSGHGVAMLRRVGIPDPDQRINQFPHQFSGGMRQRAGIAMALLMNPQLLIADEPTTALDVTMEAQIIHLLRKLQAELQTTILLVSHNLGLIAELCDEIVVMYAGEVMERGDIRSVFARPAHPYTQALIECDPARILERSRRLPTIRGELQDMRATPAGCAFAARCPHAFDRCWSEKPAAHALSDAHDARCHLLDGTSAGGGKPQTVPDANAPASVREVGAPATPADPLISVRDLCVSLPGPGGLATLLPGRSAPKIDVLLDINLELRVGETLGLVGESGSGKTTLGRTILGLVRARSGSVKLRGRELIGLGEREFRPLRANMAMMFQDPIGSLSPRQSVRSLVLEPFDVHRPAGIDRDAMAGKLADMVNLPRDLLSRYPHQLSGGQARRVGVARALALEPDLIIADEPTAGLDVSVQGEVLNLMRRLQIEHRLTYLIISHNLPVVRHVSDRLAIMYLGRIVEQGDCEAIFRRPAHPYTDALVKGIPRPDPEQRRTLVSIEGEVPSVARRPSGCEFHTRCRYAQDRCRREPPGETILTDGRTVRCHFPLVN